MRSHGPQKKKQKAAEKAYAASRDSRRTRINESQCVEHLHDELLKGAESIEELRADRDRKADECKGVRSDLSKAQEKLTETIDSHDGP